MTTAVVAEEAGALPREEEEEVEVEATHIESECKQIKADSEWSGGRREEKVERWLLIFPLQLRQPKWRRASFAAELLRPLSCVVGRCGVPQRWPLATRVCGAAAW